MGKLQVNSDYGTVVNCIDGTVQVQVIEFLKSVWKVKWVDVITEAAPEKILSERQHAEIITHLHQNINYSLDSQPQKRLAVVSHHGCDINKAAHVEKKAMLRKAVEYLKGKYTDVEVIGIWVDEKGRPDIES